jgi:hypothetical protein
MTWPLNATQITAVISGLSAAIALIAAAATAWFANKNLIRERVNQRINLVAARQKYFEDFQKWADQLVNVLTEAIHLCDLDPKQVVGETFFDRRHRLRITLSAMIDKGRWFFPNLEVDDHGVGKELGYRGYRHELLDGLVHAYHCLQRLDYRNRENNEPVRGELTAAKRHFVGQVQKIIDPTSRRLEFDRIGSEVVKSDRRAERMRRAPELRAVAPPVASKKSTSA